MLREPLRLQSLLNKYAKMRRLVGYTSAGRGRAFNRLLAEALQCWGIEATPNIRENGEIDVGLQLDGMHFVLEAKWEAGRTDTGTIAKLQKRVRQRLQGTVGIIASIAGFTPEALKEIKQGEQLAVLCLSREHIDALLSGFIPPAELFKLVVRAASLRGNPAPELTSLYTQPAAEAINLVFGAPPEVSPLVLDAVDGVECQVLASNLPFGQQGVASIGRKEILLALSSGLWKADLEKQKLDLVLGIPNCSRSPLVLDDGSILVARAAGVARIAKGNITFVAGGLPGAICLFREADQRTPRAFSNGSDGVAGAHVVSIGSSLGEQQREDLDYPTSCGMNAAQVGDESYLVIGSAGIRRVRPGGRAELISDELTNPMGLVAARTSGDFLIASDSVAVSVLSVASRSVTRLARLNLQGSVSELAFSPCGTLLFSHYPAAKGTKGIVVQMELPVV